jgi:hypothetical protein
VRRPTALAGLALAAAAAFGPLPSASAQCTDLSALGLSECASLCPHVVGRLVNDLTHPGFLSCTL